MIDAKLQEHHQLVSLSTVLADLEAKISDRASPIDFPKAAESVLVSFKEISEDYDFVVLLQTSVG